MNYFKYIQCKKCQKENFLRANNETISCENCKELILFDESEIYIIVPCEDCKTRNKILLSRITFNQTVSCGTCRKRFDLEITEILDSENQDSEFTNQEDLSPKTESLKTNETEDLDELLSSTKPGFMIALFILTLVLVYFNQPANALWYKSTLISIGVAILSIPISIFLEYIILWLAAILSRIVFYGIIGLVLLSLFFSARENLNNKFHTLEKIKTLSKYKLPKSFLFSDRFPSALKKEQNSKNPEQKIRKLIEGYGYEFDKPSVIYRSEGYKSFQNASYYIKRYGFFSKRLVAEIIKNSPADLESDCDLNFDQINGNHYRRAYELVEQDNRNLSQAYKSVLSKLYEETISVDSDPVKGLCQLHIGYCKWESYLISTGDYNIASAYSYSFSPSYKMSRKNNADPLLFDVGEECGKTKHAGLIWIKPTEFEIE